MLSRTSKGIWRTAFANEGIGAFRASDWSEPQWAALILDKECAVRFQFLLGFFWEGGRELTRCETDVWPTQGPPNRLRLSRSILRQVHQGLVRRVPSLENCSWDSRFVAGKSRKPKPLNCTPTCTRTSGPRPSRPTVRPAFPSKDPLAHLADAVTPFWGPGRGAEVYIESALLATSAALFVLAREDLLEPVTEGKSRVAAFVEEKERLIPLIKEVRVSSLFVGAEADGRE